MCGRLIETWLLAVTVGAQLVRLAALPLSPTMARRDRSYSPDSPNKRVRPSHRSSPRSPSPTRRNAPRPTRSRYDDDRDRDGYRDRDRDRERDRDRDKDRDRDRDREREREKDRDRDRDGHRDRDRYRDDRHRDDRRRDYRDDRRDDRRRSRSRDRGHHNRPSSPPRSQPPSQPDSKNSTPPVEDDKLKAKRARLEAWKKERGTKKALDEAKVKAMALAGKMAPGELRLPLARNSGFHTT